MCRLSYLASTVTVITSLLVHGRLLCGRGFEGSEEEGGTWDHSNVLAKSTLFSKLQTAALINYFVSSIDILTY